ncbi:MAG: glutamate synthase large subunit [Myxococcales bacterium]|nr:glutamate synthase large subunit [Myxococcales bacterium]
MKQTAPLVAPPGKVGLYDPSFEHDACGVGFVADVRGRRSHQIVLDADQVLRNMDHRGACGCEANTGDGAGILTALPHEFLREVAAKELGVELPEPGRFAAGNIFLPTDPGERAHCKRTFERIIGEQGQTFVGWRTVPVDPDGADIGPTARASCPAIEQLFVAAADGLDQDAFERQLYIIRKRAGTALRSDARLRQREMVYVCTLSTRVLVYKGMLTPGQLSSFYPDLRRWSYKTHLAMVHSRFSTNTFPSWDRAQPLRCMSHNGEINTLRGNVGSMNDREGVLRSELFGDELAKVYPVCEPFASDSGNFDNVLELLLMGGRSLPEAMMIMIPEAWQKDASMSEEKRAFYEFHSCLMEPWDGPASIAFTDGRYIGAVLDRNGLRPSRYILTHDDVVVMASEVGVLPIEPERVKAKGRLQPGRMFLVDFEAGRLIPDEEVKHLVATRRPYADWLRKQRIELKEIPPAPPSFLPAGTAPAPSGEANRGPTPGPAGQGDRWHGFHPETLVQRMQAFGYTTETLQFFLIPMIAQMRDPVGSMGNDSALAVLSDQPRLVYDYFKQLFAQVTNPPIDPIREEVIMSLECYCGPEGNLLETSEKHCNRLRLPHPILTNEEMAALKHMDHRGWRTKTIDITWPRVRGAAGLDATLRRISAEAAAAVDEGYSLIVLSDRATSAERVPISSLLALGAVHQHLCRVNKRTRAGLLVETGEAREVHHHCCLIGFGADAINPYLAFEALWQARRDGLIIGGDAVSRSTADDIPGGTTEGLSDEALVAAYRKAVGKGMLKVMGRMGISTLQSYKGAQIFEAIGLSPQVVERCFTGTPNRISGVGFDVLSEEAVRRHELGYPSGGDSGHASPHLPVLPNDGQLHWRASGEKHMWNPFTIRKLQQAARANDDRAYWEFAKLADEDERTRCTLRGLLRFKKTTPIPLDEVEPAKEIVRRFVTGAMSFGSISKEAHEALAIAMNELGGKSNTGEGGEDPARYLTVVDEDGKVRPNPRRSAIKQVASGRFGVTIHYLSNADEIQIKMAQGAKPGEGGELPGRKVDDVIARIRHSTPGVGLISPPPHHDIYSIEDLAQLIFDLKNANPSARISVKLVSEIGVGTVAAGVAKAHAEHILISGHDGGTGASPLTSVKHAGLPWELGVAEAHQTLVLNDLRSRVVVQTDGQLKTGRDVVIAALLGAEEYGFSTAPLITLGCIMMRKCHLNTCPVGVATQDPELRKKFAGEPEHVVNYLFMVAEHARQVMAQLGFAKVDEMIGRVDLLEVDDAIVHWKAQGLDLTPMLTPAQPPRPGVEVYCTSEQDHGLDEALDNRLIELARPALERGERVYAMMPILNVNRTVGTMLSHEIAKARREDDPLADDTLRFQFHGSAGQSFGAWLAKGVTLELEGDANDYVGKGLSGGRVIVYPPAASTFVASENVIVGNVALYGATSGEAYFRGRAAERFAVRNSGAWAVVEGVGDHACEYMTGGRVVVLGPTGRNFAAGMSGGIAYVWDASGGFSQRCNLEMVTLGKIQEPEERHEVRQMIQRHYDHTESEVARRILDTWDFAVQQLVRVMPDEYARVLKERAEREETARLEAQGVA